MRPIDQYLTLVFDCDGVILNSNRVKTNAFYSAALPYGEGYAQALVDYHVKNGGVSRYKKFQYFLDEIVAGKRNGPPLSVLLERFAFEVKRGLLVAEVANGLERLRGKTRAAKWLIVSGGDQAELREVFASRGLEQLFDGGIFGSPDNKEDILSRELISGHIRQPALFLGDSVYDLEAANGASIEFCFISGWSEVADWDVWCQRFSIDNVSDVADLLSDRY